MDREDSISLSSDLSDVADYERFKREYETLGRLGRGGFGNVYKCKYKTDKKIYAVKMIKFSDEQKEMVLREVYSISKLEHPHIIRYNLAWIQNGVAKECLSNADSEDPSPPSDADSEDEDPSPPSNADSEDEDPSPPDNADSEDSDRSPPPNKTLYIVMELCKGTLREKLEIGTPGVYSIPREHIITYFRDTLDALHYVHTEGIIHRDVSAENIFFDKCGKIKLADFGLARETEYGGTTICSNVVGKSFPAPEIAEGSKITTMVDMFGLGVVLFEMIYIPTTDMERYIALDNITTTGTFPKGWPAYNEDEKSDPSKQWLIRLRKSAKPVLEGLLSHDLAVRKETTELLFDSLLQTDNLASLIDELETKFTSVSEEVKRIVKVKSAESKASELKSSADESEGSKASEFIPVSTMQDKG